MSKKFSLLCFSILALNFMVSFAQGDVSKGFNVNCNGVNISITCNTDKVNEGKVKLFLELAKKLFSGYKESPKKIQDKLESASLECSSHIVNVCDRAQFLELARFNLRNKKLLSKLGYVFINVFSEIVVDLLDSLDFSSDEISDIKEIVREYIDIPEATESSVKADSATIEAMDKETQQIVQKFNPLFDHILGQCIGLEQTKLEQVKRKFAVHVATVLSQNDIKELYKFITKPKGAFDKIIGQIDTSWQILMKCLS